jgi:phosphate-selective porin OprO and OprP
MGMTPQSRWTSVLRSIASAVEISAVAGLPVVLFSALASAAVADDLIGAPNIQRTSELVPPLVAALPPSPDEELGEETEDERRIGSLVDKYMRRMQARQASLVQPQPASDDVEQNQKIAELQGKLDALASKVNNGKTANPVFGNDGLFFTSNDGNFKLRFGGTAQIDYVSDGPAQSSIKGGGAYANQAGIGFRRLRWRAEGTMWHNIDYVSEFDFALSLQNTDPGNSNNNPANGLQSTTANGGNGVQSGNTMSVIQPTTVFATIKEVPLLGNVRVGNQQDWFSMEHIESARFTDFMERAPIMDLYSGPNNNGYCTGISFFDNTDDKNFGWQFGAYANTAYNSGYTFNMGNAATYSGRLIWTPYYDEESNGRNLLHTGVSSEYRTFNQNPNSFTQGTNIRVRSRGDLRNAASVLCPNYLDTGNFFVESQSLIDPEIALQLGPLLLQAEAVFSNFQGARNFQGPGSATLGNNGNYYTYGGYVSALYFLTGEHRSYNRQTGVFGRTIPKNNLDFANCSYGAWQIGARYDWNNLNCTGSNGGQSVNGGQVQDVTLGVNWFLNPNMRFSMNYVTAMINNAAGNAGAVNANGALVGSKFSGDGVVQSIGGRLDVSY